MISLSILEYCNKADLTAREQYYFNKLKPVYNILKIAGALIVWLILKKLKISEALKEIRQGKNTYWYGRTMSKETKDSMSLKKAGGSNPMFGKTHSEKTKELMRHFR